MLTNAAPEGANQSRIIRDARRQGYPSAKHYSCRIIDQWCKPSPLTHLPGAAYAVNWVIIGSDNGLSPIRRQAILWTNSGLLWIGPLGTNFNEILLKVNRTFHSRKCTWKYSLRNVGHFFYQGEMSSIVHRCSESMHTPNMRGLIQCLGISSKLNSSGVAVETPTASLYLPKGITALSPI